MFNGVNDFSKGLFVEIAVVGMISCMIITALALAPVKNKNRIAAEQTKVIKKIPTAVASTD
jgi:hypothetical protein